MQQAEDVLKFWFEESSSEDWFGGKAEFDERLKARFYDLHAKVAAGEAWTWRKDAMGRVAEIIVLDQFSRQFYRGDARAFAQDPMALTLAQELVAQGLDQNLDHDPRMFAYMPYMHSESLVIHQEAMRLFRSLESEDILNYEIAHKQLLEKFGRYPKRNQALGRASTDEEIEYIAGRDGEHF